VSTISAALPGDFIGQGAVDTPPAPIYSLAMDRTLENQLLQRAREGDSHSFEQLVATHASRLLGLARRLVGDYDLAEDIVQEAFLRLHRNLSTFRGDSSIGTWLYRTVTHVAIDHLRREKLRQRIFFFRTSNDDPDPISSAADPRPRPDHALAAGELGRALEQALSRLSPRQRSIFILRHYEGLPLKEIAETLGLEEGTVKAHLHRAVSTLRLVLKPFREDAP